MSALWVFLGGGAGAVCRWALGWVVIQPWATVAVNLLGSFALALLLYPAFKVSDAPKLALGTGFLGSFTTYSTFNTYAVAALRDQDWSGAAVQIGVTVVGALLAGGAGLALAERLAG